MGNKIIVDLDNLTYNFNTISQFVGGAHQCAVVLKADCYGLKSEPIAYTLIKAGVTKIVCFSFDEGIQIRKIAQKYFPEKANIEIYILNGVYKGEEKFFKKYDLIPVLNNDEQIKTWLDFAKSSNQVLEANLQFDTGMNRSGFNYTEAKRISKLFDTIDDYIELNYIMSHFACADEIESPRNKIQADRFEKVRKIFENIPICFANSDATVLSKEYHHDLVRVGKGLYSPINIKNELGLKQVLYFESYVKEIRNNSAIIPVGYKNGYFSNLANKKEPEKSSYVFCNNKKLPVTNITENELEIPADNLKIGDEVEITGENALLEDIGKYSNNITYVLQISLCALNSDIIEYKGLKQKITVSPLEKEIVKLIAKHQKKIEINTKGNLKYFKSYITEKRLIKEDDTVGYGAHYRTKPGETLATLPIGYSDGLLRILSNTGFKVKCKNVNCEVVGNISMNQTTIKIPKGFENKINLDDEVELFDYRNTKHLESKLNLRLEEFCWSVVYKNNQVNN